MNKIVDFVRRCGYVVLLDDGGNFIIDDNFVNARGLVNIANGLGGKFSMSLAFPCHDVNRKKQKGAMQLVMTGR